MFFCKYYLPYIIPAVQTSVCFPQVEATRNAGAVQLQRGMSAQMSLWALGEDITPALASGYKYYHSISRCYSQVWNLTPAVTDDLASVSHHLHSKPLAWRVRGWCRGSDMSLTMFFSSSEGWPSGAACGEISNICSQSPPTPTPPQHNELWKGLQPRPQCITTHQQKVKMPSWELNWHSRDINILQ